MHVKTWTCLATVAAATAADQVANFILPEAAYPAYGCGDKCQKAINQAVPADIIAVGLDFDSGFYATAHNFSTSLPPGEVLKFETLNANDRLVSSGTSLFRLQYTSHDLDGAIVPATAFVALPQGSNYARQQQQQQQQQQKLPVVAWAHGTIGLFAGCAPSNGPNMYDYGTWQPLVQRGYAVVATDYAGLGSNYTSHKYLSHRAHVNDVYYSVRAARRVLGAALADEWMAAGHSQGGGAAWKLAESSLVKNDTSYLGTVAIAPATYVIDMFFDNLGKHIPALLGYFTYFPFALQRAVPSLNSSSFVALDMQKRLHLAKRMQVCISGMFAMVAGLNSSQIIDAAGLARSRPEMLAWQRNNSAAQGDTSPAPVLVVQGEADTTVLMNTTRQAWKRSCEAGNEVHLRLYAGQEHSATTEAAAPEWVGWIDERFYGRTAQVGQKNCTEKMRDLFAGSDTKAAPEE
ncbi:prolyl aminopeptidase (secreted protein) [Beauveria brongniartii RCEF 3172]|uniref:Prolyl aminopeptidase (Secreted protein) n=1 Tax=Beauveria brongniartii RCEF 3172 TaxID=1081107 RepID=A0A167DT04_9HYPO|nr:prolyl aminopeptidase (secreted protein) [Beauveria brongniartii RCEF 3172]